MTANHDKLTTAMLQKLFMEFEKDEQQAGKKRVSIDDLCVGEAKASSGLERLTDADYVKELLARVDPNALENATVESVTNNIPAQKV